MSIKPFSHVLQDKKNEFTRLFNLPAIDFIDCVTVVYMQRFSIDTVKLDDWMVKNKGYDIDKDGSLSDFIKKTYGDEAEKFINDNL